MLFDFPMHNKLYFLSAITSPVYPVQLDVRMFTREI